MLTEKSRAVLLKSSLFDGVAAPIRQALAAAAHDQAFAARAELFGQGGEPTALHIVVSGQVKVWLANAQGAPLTLNVFGPGAAVGCVAVLRQTPYPATATALRATMCAVIPRAAVAKALAESAQMSRNAVELIGARTADFVERVQEAATEDVETRIARVLLRISSGAAGETLNFTRQDIAELAGTSLHMVSRLFARWARQGLIETGRGSVAICDLAGLRLRAGAA